MEIQHFKQMSHIILSNIPETLDIGTMFDFIMENKHIKIELFYQREVSNPCKELILEYYDRLQNENGCDSIIDLYNEWKDGWTSTSGTSASYTSYVNVDSFVDINDEEFMFSFVDINDEEFMFSFVDINDLALLI
uniref:Uncharacterized protein n=1 Tax=Panagrolaimus davidi TaxID=227884 RepID=A0A914R143_9BILA